jgi:hypothetical protein
MPAPGGIRLRYAALTAAAGSGMGKSRTKRSTAALSPSIVILSERCASASGRPPERGVERVGVGVNRRVGLISAPAGDLDLIVCHLDPPIVQGRWDPRARAYLERRRAEGKPDLKRCAASSDCWHASSSAYLRQTPTRCPDRVVKVRGGTVRVPALA